MKKLILALFCIVSSSLFAQTNVAGGVFSNTTWTLANSPYIVTGNVVVFPGITLTIEPGVEVKFNNGFSLEIRQSRLIAVGTAAAPIVFTSNAASPVKGSWDKIILNQCVKAKIKHCKFEYAAIGLNGYSDSLSVTNSNFRQNVLGMDAFSNNRCTLDSNNFHSNTSGQLLQFGTFQSIRNSSYIKNGTGLESETSTNIINCIIDSNSVVGLFKEIACNDTIIYNQINANAIGFKNVNGGCGGTVYIWNNHIEQNNFGVIIQNTAVQILDIKTNCICSNKVYNFMNYTSMNITASGNCWCSASQSYIQSKIFDAYDTVSSGIVTYFPFDSTLCPINTNIGIEENNAAQQLIAVFPNPTTEFVTIDIKSTSFKTLELMDSTGKLVYTNSIEGKLIIDVSTFKQGIYTIKLRNSKQEEIRRKLIVIHK